MQTAVSACRFSNGNQSAGTIVAGASRLARAAVTPPRGAGSSFIPDLARCRTPEAGLGLIPQRPVSRSRRGRWGEQTPMPGGLLPAAATLAKAWTWLLPTHWSCCTGRAGALQPFPRAVALRRTQHWDRDRGPAGMLLLQVGVGLRGDTRMATPLRLHGRSHAAAALWAPGEHQCHGQALWRALAPCGSSSRCLRHRADPAALGTLGYPFCCGQWPWHPPGFLGRP